MDFKAEKEDYETIWHSKNPTQEELTALSLGFKPQLLKQVWDLYQNYYKKHKTVIPYPATHASGLSNEDVKLSDENIKLWDAFRAFCEEPKTKETLDSYTNILTCYKNTSEKKEYWENGKKGFVWKIYTCRLLAETGFNNKPHPDFVEFLRGFGEWPNKLDHYVEASQYLLDTDTFQPDTINSPQETFGALYGLNPKLFAKYLQIKEDIKNANDEDMFYFLNYREITPLTLRGNAELNFSRTQEDKDYPRWKNNIQTYVRSLYDRGVIFPEHSKQALKILFPDGLTYSAASPVLLKYKSRFSEKYWTLNEAVNYHIFTENKFLDMREQEGDILYRKLPSKLEAVDPPLLLGHADENNIKREGWRYRCDGEGKYKWLSDLLDKHLIDGSTIQKKGTDSQGNDLFAPKDIIKWIWEVTGVEPVPVMIELLFTPQKQPAHSNQEFEEARESLIKTCRDEGVIVNRDIARKYMNNKLGYKAIPQTSIKTMDQREFIKHLPDDIKAPANRAPTENKKPYLDITQLTEVG